MGGVVMLVRRVGHLGFAVLQCSLKIYIQAILSLKIIYPWARPIEITKAKANSLIEMQKMSIFMLENI